MKSWMAIAGFLGLIGATISFGHVQAQELGVHESKGLKDTKRMLLDPNERAKAIKGDARAEEAHAKAESLAGSQANTEEMYAISAGLMDKITKETGGDPVKMQQLLNEAQKNPQAFYNRYMSDEERARVRSLSNDIQKRSPAAPPRQ
jgi:hypothetical protein